MNANIAEIKEILPPFDLQMKYPLSEDDNAFVCRTRAEISNILTGKDPRLLVVVGPCSIHDYDAAIDYANQLLKIKEKTKTNLYIVMRVYFEKPRSRTGWKGFVYDPDLDESYDINKGLELSRKLLLQIVKLGIPVGCEFLDLISPQYISDLVSWGAIGARTSESQTHRQLASGLSMPIGFKNLTSGDTEKAINGIISSQVPHNFIGIDEFGKVSHVITKGNPDAHLILRGGDEPNYQETHLHQVTKSLKKEKIQTGIIIDCSHGNSQSNYNRQILVAIYVKRLMLQNKYPVRGIMIESNINKGNQKLKTKENLQYGQSITDACIDIDTTSKLLNLLHDMHSVEVNSLGEIRKLIRDYDKQIYDCILNDKVQELKGKTVITSSIFEKDKIVEELCHGKPNAESLSMLISMRLSLSEMVAEMKFATNPFAYLNKNNDFLKLITDREIEKANLAFFSHPIYLKLMELSKNLQVDYLDKKTELVKIGYLYGRGTFSAEVITSFKGIHVHYDTKEDLKAALDNKEVQYIIMPTYNSIIGDILAPESYWEPLGSIDHTIDLSVFQNRLGEPKTIYLEKHVEKECAQYLQKNYPYATVIPVKSSLQGCIECIKSEEITVTISSKNNHSNFLLKIADDIVEHNITTFTLYGI